MKLLLTGRTGQIGFELERSLRKEPCVSELIAPDRSKMDLTNVTQVRDVIRLVKPDLIVNAAAYTNVDQAEHETDLAMRVNRDAPAVLAEEARKLGAGMIHYSTDYVFNGRKKSPYTESDPVGAINVYGRSKADGEQAIHMTGIPYAILRTSWVYGMRRRNFLRTILGLAQTQSELRIVCDQYGTPTWCRTVAEATVAMLRAPYSMVEQPGIYHLTAEGSTTWYGFAQAILARANFANKPTVIPIATKDYLSTAQRPVNSVLDSSKFIRKFGSLPSWEAALNKCLSGYE